VRSPSGKGKATRRWGRDGSHEARADGRKGGAGHAAFSVRPYRRKVETRKQSFVVVDGGEARGSAHGSYPRSGNCQSGSHASMKRVIRSRSCFGISALPHKRHIENTYSL